ncbi:hypothetical protein HDF16_001882 [Granulicella aggregans]|uniref:Uncharacterized protein n=1 Tax=Granulicella aggregans TaxID=474949 RepID=A0A7W8E344_9BACT|nr:hypothetical protein [Granulicella aggregans]MBB5057197.1 hypothetical protein [Granulicella aggregans]
MAEPVKSGLMQATEIARQSDLRQSSNGVHYTAFGENNLENADLARIVQAVPATIASSLGRKAYYFVPLTLMDKPLDLEASLPLSSKSDDSDDPMIATTYTAELSDRAICHRDVRLAGTAGTAHEAGIDGVFISTRLLGDRFALAFEFFINVSHAFVDIAGIPKTFSDLVWEQAVADVRGETSRDAFESRELSKAKNVKTDARTLIDEKARNEYIEAAFSDAVAIYQLSLAIDFEYAELRERDYPLLAPKALADRLRAVAKLFPPNEGYEFAIRYKRRS